MTPNSKSWQEDFARFFESPSRDGLRDLLRDHVGELDNCDFKKEWPPFPKIARHILGFANSGGGCLFSGVEELDDGSFDPVGLDSLVDKADVHRGIEKFIPTQLEYEILDFAYQASEYPKIVGKKFQILLVEDSPQYIPFVALEHGDGIRKNAIYVRHATCTEEANYEELQEVVNRRIETGYSSREELGLDRHLGELKALYRHIPPYSLLEFVGPLFVKNPKYPKEDFEDFVNRMIAEKKRVIESLMQNK